MKYLHWNFLAELRGIHYCRVIMQSWSKGYPIMIKHANLFASGTRHGHRALPSQYRKPQLQWTPETPGPLRPPGTPWTPWDPQDPPP